MKREEEIVCYRHFIEITSTGVCYFNFRAILKLIMESKKATQAIRLYVIWGMKKNSGIMCLWFSRTSLHSLCTFSFTLFFFLSSFIF